MSRISKDTQRSEDQQNRFASIPVVLAILAVSVAGLFADWQNNQVHSQHLRASVLAELSVIRARLSGDVSANLQLIRGLAAAVALEPDMDRSRFEALASRALEGNRQLRSISVAPDLVVTMTYPLAGNEASIGLDYRTHETQAPAALRAAASGRVVLAGPVDLVQGGTAFVARFPVFPDDGDGDRKLWGLVSAVIDSERLYRDAGMLNPNLGIEIAVRGADATGERGAPFFGPSEIFDNDPVTADVRFPSGSWSIAAVPSEGWNTTPPNAWLLRGVILLFGVLVVFPVAAGTRLMHERQLNLQALGSREAELRRLSRRLGLALETSRVGVFEYDTETGELAWDERMHEIYGVPAGSGRRDSTRWTERLHPEDEARARQEFREAVDVSGDYHSVFRIVTPADEVRWVRAIGRAYEDPGQSRRIVGVNWDVTADVELNESLKLAKRQAEARNAELEAAKARIEHNALHDSLTGLPNRRYLDEMLKQHAAHCSASNRQLGLLHIDLDRFKQINDTLGHAAGDAMLIHASQVLKSNIRSSDFVARIGGDEFVVVCVGDNRGGLRALTGLADRIIATMRRPIIYEAHECRCGVSVGVAARSGPDIDPQRLMIEADIALYRAKSRGRNRHEVFTEALQAEVTESRRIADEILVGLEREEFIPYYQPQFDAHTLSVTGVEALARWQHGKDGILPPIRFLAVAEDLNVVASIDRLLLEQTLRDFATWRQAGHDVPRVSVNVSARRLQDEKLLENLESLGIEPGTVSFELVESIFLDESDEVVEFNIDRIKDLGIDIELDDFGTGYASIVSLVRLRPARLKIDRQLVAPIVESAAQRQLIESIIDIGRSLGVKVVGEGVETMAHAYILRDLGCDSLQGFALARPMNGGDFLEFLGRWEETKQGLVDGGLYGNRHPGRRGAAL